MSKIQVSFLVQYIFEESNVRKESHILEISILTCRIPNHRSHWVSTFTSFFPHWARCSALLIIIFSLSTCSANNHLLVPKINNSTGKEQHPVTAHARNFDFWTGCREISEIKRCDESKRTLKNPFASLLAEFNTTLKLLRIRTSNDDVSVVCSQEHRGKTHCAWAQNLTSGQLFISGLVYKPIA